MQTKKALVRLISKQCKIDEDLTPILLSKNAKTLDILLKDINKKSIRNIDLEWHGSGHYKRAFRISIDEKEKKEYALLIGIEKNIDSADFKIVSKEYHTLKELYINPIKHFFPKPVYNIENIINKDMTIQAYFDEFIRGENIGSFIKGKSKKALQELAYLEGLMVGKIYVTTGRFLYDPKFDNIKVVNNKELKIVDVGYMNQFPPADMLQIYCKYNKPEHYYTSKTEDSEVLPAQYAYENFSRPEIIENQEKFLLGLRDSMGTKMYDIMCSIYRQEIKLNQTEDQNFHKNLYKKVSKIASRKRVDLNHIHKEFTEKYHPWAKYVFFVLD